MRIGYLLTALLFLGVRLAPASTVDLTKIDRTIAKEPVYKTNPKYCLLVFGQGAKTRVWLVQDGDALYVDRNGDGDLTQKGARSLATDYRGGRLWEAGDINETDGKRKHTGLRVIENKEGMTVLIGVAGRGWQRAGGPWNCASSRQPNVVKKGQGRLDFAPQSREAPIIHFAGPLTVDLLWPPNLKRAQETDVLAVVGTFGLGPGTFAHVTHQDEVPPGGLEAVAAFPSRLLAGQPILLKFPIPMNI
jgi:hypothetical protein